MCRCLCECVCVCAGVCVSVWGLVCICVCACGRLLCGGWCVFLCMCLCECVTLCACVCVCCTISSWVCGCCACPASHRMIRPMMRKREKATPMPRPMSMPRRTVAPKVTNQTIYVRMCACVLNECVCMHACGCVHDKKQIEIPTKCHLNSMCSFFITYHSENELCMYVRTYVSTYVRTLLIIE